MPSWSTAFRSALVTLGLAFLAACGGAGGGGGSSGSGSYYHWSCNGDFECLQTNPTGQAAGTVGPVSGGQIGCESLMTFGRKFWGIPPATQSCDTSSNTPPAALVSITVTPGTLALPLGRTQQYTATGHYSDGTSRNITSEVSWTAKCGPSGLALCVPSNPATIDSGGLATALGTGSVTVRATLGSLSGSATLTVTSAVLASITVTPANPTINQYATQRFTATGHYSDGTTQVLPSAGWTSGTTSVATVGASSGVATGVAAGTSTISARFGNLSGSTELTVSAVALVSIAVTPSNPSVAKGLGLQLAAAGTYADGGVRDVTGQVQWVTDTPAVATVASGGRVTGVEVGSTTVSASLAGVTGGTTVTVTAATLQSITVTPPGPAVEVGLAVQLGATGLYSDGSTLDLTDQVTWSSGTLSVATVSGTGLATGVAAGSSLVAAAMGGISGSTSLTVYALGSRWVAGTGAGGGALPTAEALYGIAWTGSTFVAVGGNGTILTSPDGLAWTAQPSGVTATLYAVLWTGTQLVTVGTGGTVLTSPDGIAWTARSSGVSFVLYAVTWTGSQLVAVGNSGSTSVTSPDGITWTAVNAAIPPPGYNQYDQLAIAWDGARYYVSMVTISNYFQYYPTLYATSDLQNFTYIPNASGPYVYGMLWTGTELVAVQSGGGIMVSQDFTWTGRTSGTSAALRAVTWTGNQLSTPCYVVVGDAGTVLTSTDTIGWTVRTSGTANPLRAVAWSGSHFVAVGDAGTVLVTAP